MRFFKFVLALLSTFTLLQPLPTDARPLASHMKTQAEAVVTSMPLAEGFTADSFSLARERGIADLSLAEKAADYDAFWDILENSFPMYDYLQRNGICPTEIKERYRTGLAQLCDEVAWQDYFSTMIKELTAGHGDVGHLAVVNRGNALLNSEYQTYHYYLAAYPEDPWVHMMVQIFGHPHVLGFYDLEVEEREPETGPPFIDLPGNLYMEYNVAADYAYVAIASFLNENPEDARLLQEFFLESEAQGIGNIIIDIRGNSGGYNDYWLLNIVSPNITEPLMVENFGLYKDSPWNRNFLDYYAGSTFEEDWSALQAAGDLPTMIFNWNQRTEPLPEMPELVADDVANLDSLFQETIRIEPSYEEPLFSGKFWLLSDGGSYSASEYFISFAKRTGFATIVGEASGGDGSCVVTIYNALPESGLLLRYNALYGLNSDGSNSEDSATPPDYGIAPGESALQKTLDLIAAGQ